MDNFSITPKERNQHNVSSGVHTRGTSSLLSIYIYSCEFVQEESVHDQLLRDIVYLMITTRAHSKVQKVKEDHKKAKAQGV